MQPGSRWSWEAWNFDLGRPRPAGREAQVMRNAHRPMGRFFCVLMAMAMGTLAAQQTNGPAMTQVVEGLFGHQTGTAKKNAALTLVQTTISATDLVAGKNIVDAGKF